MNEFRDYLLLLARVELDSRLEQKMDASDIVQQTLLDAHQKQEQFRGTTDAEKAAWLRQILANNLVDAMRRYGSQKRNLNRELSLEANLERSSQNLHNWLIKEQSSPDQRAVKHENALIVANALAQLPDAQREALVLQKWNGWTLKEIADDMGRETTAVAGLLKRGLRRLREIMAEQSSSDGQSAPDGMPIDTESD